MSAELGAFQFGASVFPLTASTAKSLLEDADPAIFHALRFLSGVFEIHIAPRLKAQALLHGLHLPKAVVSTAAMEPAPFLMSDQFRFPLMCLFRKKDTWAQHTMVHDKSTSTWELAYVLPPLTPLQARELQPVLRAASVVLRRSIQAGFDPSFNAGEVVWATANLQKARIVDVSYGGFEQIDKLDKFYRAIAATIEVTERDMPLLSAFDDFDGADAMLLLQDAGGTTVGIVDAETHKPPSVLGVSPASGPAAGGTAVTITGVNFRPGTRPNVFFDGGLASDVVAVDASTLTCKTPPHDAFPSFVADVTIVNSDGQQTTLPSAFTFTA